MSVPCMRLQISDCIIHVWTSRNQLASCYEFRSFVINHAFSCATQRRPFPASAVIRNPVLCPQNGSLVGAQRLCLLSHLHLVPGSVMEVVHAPVCNRNLDPGPVKQSSASSLMAKLKGMFARLSDNQKKGDPM